LKGIESLYYINFAQKYGYDEMSEMFKNQKYRILEHSVSDAYKFSENMLIFY